MENFTLTLASGSTVFDGTAVVFTSADGSTVTTFVNQATMPTTPVVTTTDTGITVTHEDGTTANFVPEQALPEASAEATS